LPIFFFGIKRQLSACVKMSDFPVSRSGVDGEDVTLGRLASRAPNIVLYQIGSVRLEHRPIEREISDVYRYESAMDFFKDQPVAALSLSLAVESKLACAYAIQHESLKQLEDARERITELKGRIAELMSDKIVQKNDWDEHKRVLVEDSLRSKGLLSARGIFERYLQLIAGEHKLKGKFNASEVCNRLKGLAPAASAGSWTKIMVQGIETATPGTDVSDYANNLYGVLCRDIHGHPWSGTAVELLFDDSIPEDCVHLSVLRCLCKGMGLM
jgi:hypothetical protein